MSALPDKDLRIVIADPDPLRAAILRDGLVEELAQAQNQLADRKAIDQAKALVMKAKNISEDQAYAMMHKVAMNEGRKIAEIARSIITAAELLK
jgi:two-component system, response regulator / RNA-binding antiterminator